MTQKSVTDALGNKVDKTSDANKVYATDSTGAQTTIVYDRQNATPSSIVQRDLSGQINIPLVPTADKHAASKQYVDNSVNDATITITQGGATKGSFTVNQSTNATIAIDAVGTVDQVYDSTSTNAQSGTAVAGAIADKVSKVTPASGTVVYAAKNSGDITLTLSESNTAYTVAYRSAGGQLNVAQTPTSNNHATSKKYVDDKVKDATITITQGGVSKGSFTVNQAADATIALDAGGGAILPTQTGHAEEFLKTDGTDLSWDVATTVTYREWGANE